MATARHLTPFASPSPTSTTTMTLGGAAGYHDRQKSSSSGARRRWPSSQRRGSPRYFSRSLKRKNKLHRVRASRSTLGRSLPRPGKRRGGFSRTTKNSSRTLAKIKWQLYALAVADDEEKEEEEVGSSSGGRKKT